MSKATEADSIAVIEETLEIGKRDIERGRVVIRKHVEVRSELAEAALRRSEVDITRVPIGQAVESAPAIREEDGVVIVPVLEERLVLRTELFLVEEVRISQRERIETVREPVQLRSERVEIERLQCPDPTDANIHGTDKDDGTNPDGDV